MSKHRALSPRIRRYRFQQRCGVISLAGSFAAFAGMFGCAYLADAGMGTSGAMTVAAAALVLGGLASIVAIVAGLGAR